MTCSPGILPSWIEIFYPDFLMGIFDSLSRVSCTNAASRSWRQPTTTWLLLYAIVRKMWRKYAGLLRSRVGCLEFSPFIFFF